MAEENTSKKPESEAPSPDAKSSDNDSPKSTEKVAEKKPPVDKKPAAKAAAQSDKPAAKKKEKPPAPEDKPFLEFINQHFLPSLKDALAKEGITDMTLELRQARLPMAWIDDKSDYWQVRGQWQDNKRQFILAFQKDDIKAPKFIAIADQDATPTTLESFMIDERRVNLDLMVLYVLQRLNGQKWLVRN
jgi:hypothetical protein